MTDKDNNNKNVIKEITLIYYITCCPCNKMGAIYIIIAFTCPFILLIFFCLFPYKKVVAIDEK